MKVGIVGDAKRAVAWEQHLRPHRIVHEVDLSPVLKDMGDVDACLILDESENNLNLLMEGVRQGLNCFLISEQPTNKEALEKIHRAAREAGVYLQFSHWPTLAPASQWMMSKLNRPSLINITKEINYSSMVNPEKEFRHYWIDELGFCLKWVGSGIHHIEAKEVRLDNSYPLILHLFLRFDNGTSADISIYTGASENRHVRIASNKQEVLECDVPTQSVRAGRVNSSGLLYFDKQKFDPAKSAEKAALMFLKAIQMKKETPYSSYDAYQLSVQTERVMQRLKQFS